MRVTFIRNVDMNDPERRPIWNPEPQLEDFRWNEIHDVTLSDMRIREMDDGPGQIGTRIRVDIDKNELLIKDLLIVDGGNKTVMLLDEEKSIKYNMTTADFVNMAMDGRISDGKVLGPFKIAFKGVRTTLVPA